MPMTPDEQRDTHEVYEISVKAFEDGIELLHLIEVMQAQNNDAINEKLSAAGAAGAAMVVRNGLLSRIILFLAGAYAAPTRPGDLHLRRAFDLLQQPAVRDELGLRGSPTLLDDATRLWARCKGDHRLLPIKHFRDKFTAHLGKPKDIPFPQYDDVFGFAQDTMMVVDALARGTGAQCEPLSDWQPAAEQAAGRFWSVWR